MPEVKLHRIEQGTRVDHSTAFNNLVEAIQVMRKQIQELRDEIMQVRIDSGKFKQNDNSNTN